MDCIFSEEYKVRYKDANKNLEIKLGNFLEYLQETSVDHTSFAGYTPEWYSKNKCAFILSNWQIEIYSYPKMGEQIKVVTNPISFKGIIAERLFRVFNEKEELVLIANTKWVYMDLAKKRPIKITEEIINNFKGIGPSFLPVDYSQDSTDGYQLTSKANFKTTKRDIDSNDHVNNLKYIDWITDLFDDETYYEKKFKKIKVEYKKECKCDTNVTLELYKSLTNKNKFIGLVLENETILAKAEITT